MATVCPSRVLLRRFVDRQLEPVEAAGLEMHIDTCDGCRAVVVTLVRERAPRSELTTGEVVVGLVERGARVGRYVIVNHLGAGGMGVVYSAYDPELDRKVALKIVKAADGDGAAQAQERLWREAQAMARLAHPNVIRVFDVESGRDGMVVLAMELIEGMTLRRWAAARRRPWREVVRVLVDAGRGLAAAHRAGVVHRDFKPDNVLVGNDGRVLVTDFGLARVQHEAEDAPRADVGGTRSRRAGTPAYMAPEQLGGAAADARSDQYSFSVSLHEAVFGARPGAARETGWRWRSVVGMDVPRGLKAALARGLSPDPTRRFASMDDLLAAVERTVPSRARLVIELVALAAVALAGVVLVHGGLDERAARRCAQPDPRSLALWDAATRGRVRAAFIASGAREAAPAFAEVERKLEGYVLGLDAMRADACAATHLRNEQSASLLDLRLECLRHRGDELASLVAVLGEADPAVVRKAVDAVQSLSPLPLCAETSALLRRAEAPVVPRLTPLEEVGRAQLRTAKALADVGRYREARSALDLAASTLDTVGATPLTAAAELLLARLQRLDGQHAAALQSLGRAAALAERAEDDRSKAEAFIELADVHGTHLMNIDEALSWAALADVVVARHPESADLRARLAALRGLLQWHRGDVDAGIEHLTRAVWMAEQLGAGGSALAAPLQNLAGALTIRGRFREALGYYERSFNVRVQGSDEDGPLTVNPRVGRALALLELGRAAEAVALLERALAVQERELGPERPALALTLGHLGRALGTSGRLNEALAAHNRAITIAERAGDGPGLAWRMLNKGETLLATERCSAAREVLRRASRLAQEALKSSDPYLGTFFVPLGRSELECGDPATAVRLLERAQGLMAGGSLDPRLLAAADLWLGYALDARGGSREQARALVARGLARLGGLEVPVESERRRAEAWLRQREAVAEPR